MYDGWLAVDEGDGQICKSLRSFGYDETAAAKLLKSNIRHKLFDDHIWLSVGYRQNKSDFNRVQRLCCCLAILFLTMIANAVWYKTEEKTDTRFVLTAVCVY